jgi:1,4-alpha-glucan branching enzyme
LGFSAQWNESLCYALRGAVIPASDAARPMQPIVDALNALSGPNAFKYVVYTENHDKDDASGGGGRLPDLIHPGQSDSWESKKRSTLAAAVVMTAPAIPMIFEGQEFLAWQPFPNGGAQPAQIDWTMATTFAGITSLYRDMIHLRRNWFNSTRGLQGANLHILPVFAGQRAGLSPVGSGWGWGRRRGGLQLLECWLCELRDRASAERDVAGSLQQRRGDL